MARIAPCKMPKIFLLRHAFAEQQATLEDASKFSTHHRQEEVGFYILSYLFTSPGTIGRQRKVSITFLTSLLSFPPRGGRFFCILSPVAAHIGKKRSVFIYIFRLFSALAGEERSVFTFVSPYTVYSIRRQEKVSYPIFFRPI